MIITEKEFQSFSRFKIVESVIMYYFAVTVLIFQLLVKINSEEFCPNVKVELKGFPHLELVEYTISPLNADEELPVPILENQLTITLSSMRIGIANNWWGLNLVKQVLVDRYYWHRTFTLPMIAYNKEQPEKNYKFLNNNFTCMKEPMKVEHALVVDDHFPYLMNQYGCNKRRSQANMDKNLIFLI